MSGRFSLITTCIIISYNYYNVLLRMTELTVRSVYESMNARMTDLDYDQYVQIV